MSSSNRQRTPHEPRHGTQYDAEAVELLLGSPRPTHTRHSPGTLPHLHSVRSSNHDRQRIGLLRQPYLTITAFLLCTIFVTWFPGLSILTRLVDAFASSPPPPSLRGRYHRPILHGERYATQAVSSLPAWEPAVRNREWCTNHTLFDGQFYRTNAGEVMYEPASCKLPRPTAQQARSCLANRTLLFVGDSITRYQYVSLAHFLVHSLYPQRYADDPTFPSVCLEKQFPSWEHYFAFTSALLSTPTPNQPVPPTDAREHCHCFRPAPGGVSHATYEHHHLTLTYPTPPVDSSEPSAPTPTPSPAPADPPTLSTLRIAFNLTLAWPSIHGGPIEAIQHAMAQRLTPDTIILNVGAWFDYGPLRNAYNLSSATAAFEPLFRPPATPPNSTGPRLIWRTMSDGVLGQQVVRLSGVMDGLARYYDWEWMDIRRVTEVAARQGVGMRWDNLHFLPAMYDQWNDLLLHMLCAGR